jgi:hypothetical protein
MCSPALIAIRALPDLYLANPKAIELRPASDQGLLLITGVASRVACKSMNRVQEQKHHLAQANRHIAELNVQIAHQRVIIKDALATDQRSAMAESLLDALERSLRIFEKHRIFLLSYSVANNGRQGKPRQRGRG